MTMLSASIKIIMYIKYAQVVINGVYLEYPADNADDGVKYTPDP